MTTPPSPQTAAETIAALRAKDPTATALDIDVDKVDAPSLAQIVVQASMTVTEAHCNFMGTGHGGVIFTACDVVFSYLSNAFGTAVATHATIDFVAPVRPGDRLVVAGHLVERAGRTALFDITASVDDGVVALFRGSTRDVRPNA